MKRHELNSLVRSIKSLEGRHELAKDGDGKLHGIILKPFDISAKARYAFAKTLRKLTEIVSDYEKVQKDKKAENKETANDEIYKFMCEEEETPVEFHKVNIVELKIETNQLSPEVIADLLPMLDGEL